MKHEGRNRVDLVEDLGVVLREEILNQPNKNLQIQKKIYIVKIKLRHSSLLCDTF